MADVYLSYARKDQHWAEQVAAAIARSGWSIAWDQITQPGQQVAGTLHEELQRAKCILVLWSRNSRQSEFVRMEAIEAHRRNVLISVLIEDITSPGPFPVSNVTNLTDWSGSLDDPAFKQISEAIRRIVSGEGARPTAEAAAPSANGATERREDLGEGHVVITMFAPRAGVVRWLVKAGTSVRRSERVAEIDDADTTTPLTAPDKGDLESKYIAEGGRVERGQRVALIRQQPPIKALSFGPSASKAPVPPETPKGATPTPADHSTLFLCYRRDDTQVAAGWLHDTLSQSYGANRVFMDIDSVPLGVDFVEHVSGQIARCAAVIVMIGKEWLKAKDKRRRRRLDNEDDLVRAEIAAALNQKIPVIPVLVQGAQMPTGDDLPDNIRPLARRNGIELSATRWKTDVERLIEALDRVMKPSTSP